MAPVTLVSYIVKEKPKRNLLILSTQPENDAVSYAEKIKLDIVLFYNSSKSVIDSIDQMTCKTKFCKKRNKKVARTLFYTLIDVVCINAYTLCMKNFPNWKNNHINRRLFFFFLSTTSKSYKTTRSYKTSSQ